MFLIQPWTSTLKKKIIRWFPVSLLSNKSRKTGFTEWPAQHIHYRIFGKYARRIKLKRNSLQPAPFFLLISRQTVRHHWLRRPAPRRESRKRCIVTRSPDPKTKNQEKSRNRAPSICYPGAYARKVRSKVDQRPASLRRRQVHNTGNWMKNTQRYSISQTLGGPREKHRKCVQRCFLHD